MEKARRLGLTEEDIKRKRNKHQRFAGLYGEM